MGAQKKNRERFLAEHPFCYFCATAPTETEDHVPSRECFRNREGPEGFGFPACKSCNHSASKIEQAVALYIHMSNHENTLPTGKQIVRLMCGVQNNTPELVPKLMMNSRLARRHFRDKNIPLAPGQTYAGTPIIELPSANREAFELFIRRLTCALHYKEIGHPVPLDHLIAVAWVPWVDPIAANVAMNAKGIFPELTRTNRRNTNIGDQFHYLWGHSGQELTFGFAAQFSKSFLMFGATVAPGKFEGGANWKQHHLDVSRIADVS